MIADSASPSDVDVDVHVVEEPPRAPLTKGSHIWAAVLVLIGLLSFFALAPLASNPATLSGVRDSLDSQQATVSTLAAAATGIAAGLSVIGPQDALTPVADKLIEVSGWFVVILVAIIAQKILVTVSGAMAFLLLVPLACALAILSIYARRPVLRVLALKLATFAVVLALAVPVSIWVSTALTATYTDAASAANAAEDAAENAPAEEATESGSDEGFIAGIQSWVADAVDNVGSFVEEANNDAVRASEYYSEQFALLLVTTCIMPILVLLLLWWVIKMLFGVNIGVPRAGRAIHSKVSTGTKGAIRRVTRPEAHQVADSAPGL